MLGGVVLAISVVAGACGAGPSGTPDAAGAVRATTPPGQAGTSLHEPVARAVETPTVPGIDDEERVAVAVAALERDGLGDLIAWDVLEAAVDGELVSLTLCGWTGQTVFDVVVESRWVTDVVDGLVVATSGGSNSTSGECLNSELIGSVLEFTREYDDFHREVAAAPDRFASDPRGRELQDPDYERRSAVGFARWTRDGITALVPQRDGRLPGSALEDVLYRRVSGGEQGRFELIACRLLDPSYGLYRGPVRLDGAKSDEAAGNHAITLYELTRSEERDRWVLAGVDELVWGDCLRTGDWPGAVAEWRPGEPWAPLR